MHRVGVIAALTALWTALVAADVAQPSRTFDLNAPGAIETLQQSRPAQFEKVRRILEGVSRQSDQQVRQWMHVRRNAGGRSARVKGGVWDMKTRQTRQTTMTHDL
jgi:hypothetical protein